MKKYIPLIALIGIAIYGPLTSQAQTQSQTPIRTSQPQRPQPPTLQSAPLTDSSLQALILHNDSLFWNAYNHCDVPGMKTFFTTDCEFYHDKGGPTLGLDPLMQSISNNLCKEPDNYSLRREAVPGTVHVYPLHNNGSIYGAIISGEHVFYIRQAGKTEYLDSHALFTHLWLFTNGQWKMARVLSFNHHAATYANERTTFTVPNNLLQEYAGKYKGPENSVEIKATEGNLTLLNGEKTMTLYPETTTRFFSKERDLTFEFTKDNGHQKMVVREHGAIAEELVKE